MNNKTENEKSCDNDKPQFYDSELEKLSKTVPRLKKRFARKLEHSFDIILESILFEREEKPVDIFADLVDEFTEEADDDLVILKTCVKEAFLRHYDGDNSHEALFARFVA